MNMKTCRWILVSAVAATLTAIAVVYYKCWTDDGIHPVSEQAAKEVAQQLLAQKLSGPRYFSPSYWENGEPWIEVQDAWSQVPRVITERNLGPDDKLAIGQLIEKMSEPHPHRMVGGERINLSRFNLSLDAIKWKSLFS